MTASREKHELVELGEVHFRAPFFVGESFAFRAVNFPLHATLVETAEQEIKVGAKIQGLKRKRPALHEIRTEGVRAGERTKFDIPPVFQGARSIQPIHYFGKARTFGERLTMIRERERDEAAAAQPTLNSAKDEAIFELLSRRSGGKSNGLIAVRAAKRFEPTSRVKYGAVRVAIEKPRPARIIKRIKLVYAHSES